MTSFIAWSGADTHGTSSLYFASDSRISWDKFGVNRWDTGAKVLASKNHPELFGYTGYALLPFTVLTQACTAIDAGLRDPQAEKSADGKCDWLSARIEEQTRAHPALPDSDFTILYGVRSGTRTYIQRKGNGNEPPVHDPSDPRATFTLYVMTWNAASGVFKSKRYPVPHSGSAIVCLSGTGADGIQTAQDVWRKSSSSGTSRTMFSSLCDALRKGDDKQSGGAPQLVGLYRKENGRTIGVVTQAGAFFQGVPFRSHPGDAVEWRNESFDVVDSQGLPIKRRRRG
ncbi:hypothetical protein P245_14320 [Comamonas thiooxydans]|uniref:Uncharacterized protein n=1 Tax=Comamonas thiooxydans TaxID=363952 RepID=A0A0E3BFN8_9BURK|nr:hypothetical protein [Comamonas thiooxydans]KGG90987.1 hypothetical protein P245_14320 [Comamonas thiooxydans]